MKGRFRTATFFAFLTVLFIPYAHAAARSKSPVPPSPESVSEQKYVIRSGDSLYRIARTFGITQEALMAANNLNGNKLKIGQVLKVPAKSAQVENKPLNHKKSRTVLHEPATLTATQLPEAPKTDLSSATKQGIGNSPKTSQPKTFQNYVTRKGDTLFQIARTFNTTPKALKSANKLKSSRIKTGQTLKVPAIESAESRDKSPVINQAPVRKNETIITANVQQQTTGDQTAAEKLPLRDRLVEAGFRMLGVRYRFSGTSERTGLDCSALVKNLFSKVDIALPRSSKEQFKEGEKIDRDNLEAGDLVFFSSGGKTPTHVGIYIGNNQFIHAARKAKQVIVSDLNKLWYSTRYLGARRIMDLWWEDTESSSDSENK